MELGDVFFRELTSRVSNVQKRALDAGCALFTVEMVDDPRTLLGPLVAQGYRRSALPPRDQDPSGTPKTYCSNRITLCGIELACASMAVPDWTRMFDFAYSVLSVKRPCFA